MYVQDIAPYVKKNALVGPARRIPSPVQEQQDVDKLVIALRGVAEALSVRRTTTPIEVINRVNNEIEIDKWKKLRLTVNRDRHFRIATIDVERKE